MAGNVGHRRYRAMDARRRGWRRPRIRLVLLACLGFALLLPASSSAQTRAFDLRFGENVRGNIGFAANTLVQCPVTDIDTCQAGAVHNNLAANNNGRRVGRLDVDGNVDLTGDGIDDTETSSRAVLSMPPGSEVLFAGLYWAGNVPADYSESDPADTDAWLNTLIDPPGAGGYQAVTGTELDTEGPYGSPPSVGHEWNSFADVTSIVQAAGAGEYTVGGVPIHPNTTFTNGVSSFGGWALWIVYGNPNEPWRNLSVFDGFQGPTQTFSISGFVTPPSGAFNTAVGVSAVEGDGGTTGDAMQINGVNLQDALTPANNFFNSRITRFGTDDGDRTPNFLNHLGWDAKLVDADAVNPSIVPNGATSADVTITSSGDGYRANAIATAIEIFAPDVTVTKGVDNVDRPGATDAHPGEVLEYTVEVENASGTASDTAEAVVLRDGIPTGTTYVPGSLQMVSGDPAPTGARTDAAGDDSAEHDGGSDEAVFRLGDGANATSGGTIDPGESSVARFRVNVDPGTEGQTVTNDAGVDLRAATTEEDLTETSNQVSTPITAALSDLSLAKSVDPAVADAGQQVTYTLTATNDGPDGEPSAVITDTLPSGVTYVSDDGGCVTSALPVITCALGAMADGDSRTVNVTVQVNLAAAGSVQTNAASVSGDNVDSDPQDNDDSVDVLVRPLADLALQKTASPGTVNPGDPVTYTLTVSNNGPIDSPGATITDTLPTGVTYASDNAGCDTSALPQITCPVGAIPNGNSAAIQVTVTVNGGAGGTIQTNAASVTGQLEDSDADNNEDDADVLVTPLSDLSITKDAPASVRAGEELTYTLNYANGGPTTSDPTTVTDTLPAGVTYVSDNAGCDVSSLPQISCGVGSLAPSGTGTIQIVVEVDLDTLGGITNSAAITGGNNDQNPDNNDDDATTNVVAPLTDLQITKDADPAVVDPGGTVAYTLTITNNGPGDSASAEVTDTLPAGVTYVSDDTGCDTSGLPTLTCDLGTIANGGSETIEIQVTADAGSGGSVLTNTATVMGPGEDTEPSNDSDTADTLVTPLSDLSVTKIAPATARAGNQLTYEIDYANAGPTASNPTVITDTLPAGVTYVSDTGGCDVSALPILTCDVGSVASSGTGSFELVVSVDAATRGAIENGVGIDGPNNDQNPSNNEDLVSTEVSEPLSDLSLEKTAGGGPFAVGQEITYTLRVTNQGPDDAPQVVVTDNLPSGLSYVSDDAGCDTSALPTVSCHVGTLADGASKTITMTTRLDAANGSSISNSASVRSANPDPTPGNDADSAAAGIAAKGAKAKRCFYGHRVTILGTRRSERIVGTPGRDVINGRRGKDTIIGLDGNDLICGGGDDDLIIAGRGDDGVKGSTGDDVIRGNRGDDWLRGAPGNDRISGRQGADKLMGNNGDDRLRGRQGNDFLLGGPGRDWGSGGPGLDRAIGLDSMFSVES